MHVNGRRLVDAYGIIGVKIRLLDRAIFHCDLILERRTEPVNDRALCLSPDGLWIHDLPAVNYCKHAVNFKSAAFHRDLGHLADIAAERMVGRDAASFSFGQWRSPGRFFGRKFQYRTQPRWIWIFI